MREIKFRCWNTHSGVMHDWCELVDKNKIHLLASQKAAYPIMQFTGLKDCNGTEIYEGDVVLFSDGEFSFSGEVEFSEYGYVISINDRDKESLFEFNTPELKIIGNIHQNPEQIGKCNG